MKKIDKSIILATKYKQWIDNIDSKRRNHPTYTSSNNKYYYDIVGNLLWVQHGLCAYTEMFLSKISMVNEGKWNAGTINKFEFLGQLDHYDFKLKEKKGWEWDNFFVIHSDVNTKRKRDKGISGVLKPDKDDYNPFFFLEYDFKTHHFIPNRERTIVEQSKILNDIYALGLNYQPIIDYRADYIKPILDDVSLGKLTIVNARQKLNKFYTAFEMSILNLKVK